MPAASRPLRLLLVEKSDAYAAHLGALLADVPSAPGVVRFARLDEALRHLAHVDIDCVLLDLDVPDAEGVLGLERLLAAGPHVPVVALAAHAEDGLPVQLIRAGAQDFLVKGTEDGASLMRAVRNAVERRRSDERLQVERMVREVAAEVRGGRPRGASRAGVLGGVALAIGFAIQIAVLRHPAGAVLWVLFAAAAILAWRARERRYDGVWLLQAIVEGSTDAVFVKDLEGRYLLANDAAGRLLGHTAQAIVGRTDADLMLPEEAAARRGRDEAVMASGETRRYWRTADQWGVQRSLSVIKTPYRDRDGRVVGLIATVRDETDVRRLEEETSRFFDLAPDMLCTMGADGSLERVNGAWTAVLGWTADELRARPLLDFVHPEDRGRAGRDLERMLAGVADECVNRLATRAGGWRDVEWTARVVPEDGRVYAVARNVSDRSQMASALLSSESRYRTLVHNLPNAAVVTFDHDLRFTFAAGEALGSEGLDADIVGRSLAEVLPAHAMSLAPRYRAALGGHSQSFEFTAASGREYWVQIAPLRDGEGAIDGGMLISQDVSERRAA